ncbi:MAG: hypothetical protein JWP78_2035 [Mucilaginibacter sp.]|nr:hypothetical protein [Mucilaginibacter sp.]
MNRDWNDFKSIHSNIAGAREAFENACETLFRKVYTGKHVSQVKVKQGDGGIDVFVGELGVEPITVIQCKFFLETFEESQKSQIRDSFDTALNSGKFELKEWILCLPRIIDIDENSWWFKWKHKKITENAKGVDFIQLTNGNKLIDLLKEHNLYNSVFEMEDSLKIAEIHQTIVGKKPITVDIKVKPRVVLFNNYSLVNEPYYFQRKEDEEFNKSLEINNVWLFGHSGFGKTALINRNLLVNNVEYCYCDLSPINILKSGDVLDELLNAIEEQFSLTRTFPADNKIKQIIQTLYKAGHRKFVIVIDELSVTDSDLLKQIVKDLNNLVTHFCNYSDQDDLKFVVSTITDPNKILEANYKASDYFQFISCNQWDGLLEKLFHLLNDSLQLQLIDYKDLIIEKAKNSPRTLKSIFRKILLLKKQDSESINQAIHLTITEVV